jgi:hypothetical protein
VAFIKFLFFILVLIICAVFFTLHRNDANLLQPPGIYKRLTTFLTTNSASTSDDPEFAELRTPEFNVSSDILYQAILDTGNELGWGVLTHDSDELNVNFISRTPVFLFEDDVFVQVKSTGENTSQLYIESASRTGNVDLAANSGHIQQLVNALKQKIPQ